MDHSRPIAVPRAADILWRIVIGLLAVLIIAVGGALLMHASIDQSLEEHAAPQSVIALPRPN